MLNNRQFRQGRLFAPVGMTKKPHQQTPMEFANSPRTMWHGSDMENFDDLRAMAGSEGSIQPFEDQGFHMGTPKAAFDRMRQRGGRDTEAYVHPVQVQRSQMENRPSNPISDQGEMWMPRHHNKYYENDVEDVGSISAVVEDPADVMHHGDYVGEAIERGGIPSGAAEYMHSDPNTRRYGGGKHIHQTRGFRRSDVELGITGYEERSSGYAGAGYSPQRPVHEVRYAQRGSGRWPGDAVQGSMFEQKARYNAKGNEEGVGLYPRLQAVPNENLSAVQAEDEARKAPWLSKMEREAADAEQDLGGTHKPRIMKKGAWG